MANATTDRVIEMIGTAGRKYELPVAATTTLYKGTLASVLTATGDVVASTTASSEPSFGVIQHGVDNSAGVSNDKRVIVESDCIAIMVNDTSNPVSEANLIGCPLYATDDHTVSDTNTGADPLAGYFAGLEPDSRVKIYLSPIGIPSIATFAAALHDHEDAAGGGQITPADALDAAVPATLGGTGQTTTTAGDVLVGGAANTLAKLAIGTTNQVLAVDSAGTALEYVSTLDPDLKGTIEIPIGTITDVDGDFTKFVNGGADGLTLADSKAVCYRINNAAPPPQSLCGFVVPADANVTADFTLKIMCSKSGATVGDATTITAGVYNQVVGALHDADTDYGGVSDALTGDATSKTVATLSLALASADLPVVGSGVSISFAPTNGTLGTDDLLIHRMWVEYTKALDA